MHLGWRSIQKELEYSHNNNSNVNDSNQINYQTNAQQTNKNNINGSRDTLFVKIKHINGTTSSSIPSMNC